MSLDTRPQGGTGTEQSAVKKRVVKLAQLALIPRKLLKTLQKTKATDSVVPSCLRLSRVHCCINRQSLCGSF
eukprot:s2175_g6.t1